MIIKGLFRRYERWNPVHPTSGAFWGMGLGIGCGVGWGPGFGPEVVGYVGAGCGVGFSVGITLVGVGIGLPANCVYEVPYNAIMTTRSGVLDFGRSTGSRIINNIGGDGWNNIALHVSDLQRETSGKISSFKAQTVDLFNVNTMLPVNLRSIWGRLEAFGDRFFCPGKGLKD